MKYGILLLLASFFICSLAFTQQQFGFKKKSRSDFSMGDKEISEIFSLQADSIKGMVDSLVLVVGHTRERNRQYKFLAEEFRNMSDELRRKTDAAYSELRKQQLKRLKESEVSPELVRSVEANLQLLEEDERTKMEIVFKLEDAAKAMEYKFRASKNFNLFPVHNSIDAQLYYEYYIKEKRTSFLKNSLLSIDPDGGRASLYNEIFADYAGPVRIGFGALVSNKDTRVTEDANGKETIDSASLQNDAIQRLLGGGGNVGFNASFPLLGYLDARERIAFKLIFLPKFAFDVPGLGTENNDYTTNVNLGVETSMFYTGVLDILTFYGTLRVGRTWGNDKFYEYLQHEEKQSFGMNQVTLGVAINSTFRISFNHFGGSDFVKKNFPNSISFSIVPN